jgi:hypothetical protein
MSNAAIIIHEDGGSSAMVDILTFAELRGVDHRTVREWLRRDLLPGAQKDGRGKWHIPVDAVKQEKPVHEPKPDAAIVDVVAPVRAEDLITEDGATRPRPRAFFTVPEAAELLGISPYRIRENRDAFGVVPWGPNGLLLVPAPVVRQYLGL